jgi:polygalacturonase
MISCDERIIMLYNKHRIRYFGISVIVFLVLTTLGNTIFAQSSIPGAWADGIHKDTKAIQNCIDSINNAGGGTIIFSKGRYLTAPLILRSNNHLTVQIDSGATILASVDTIDYYVQGADTTLPLTSVQNFISASGFQNLTIQGKGTIDGQGARWWSNPNGPRPRMLQLNKGSHLLVKDVTLTNSAMFHLCPNTCYDVVVDHITIIAPSNSPNTDGIDPSICHNVRITNCTIDNGDDNIAIGASSPSAGWSAASTDIIIKHNTFLHGHGVSIGSYTTGGVDSMLVDSCTFNETTNGIRIKSQRGRGGEVRNITYSNLSMTNVRYPIYFTAYYSGVPPQSDPPQPINSQTPYFHDLKVINLTSTNTASNSAAGIILGLPERPLTNIQLQNVKISAYKGIQTRWATVTDPDTNMITVTSGPRFIYEVGSKVITNVKNESVVNPSNYALEQNYPNPFNPSTTIRYQVPEAGFVKLRVYNIPGQEVATLVNENKAPGFYEINFDASKLASGIYIYRLMENDFVLSKKMILLK